MHMGYIFVFVVHGRMVMKQFWYIVVSPMIWGLILDLDMDFAPF